MQADLFLVVGVFVGVLAIPALLSAYTHNHAPRAGAIMVLISGGLIVLASSQNPKGYTIGEFPDVFSRVLARYLN